MLKELIKEDIIPEAFKELQWYNLIFTKDGVSHVGVAIWPSIAEAKAAIKRGFAKEGWNCKDGEVEVGDYSWDLQLPLSD